jgi:hypothetical protein
MKSIIDHNKTYFRPSDHRFKLTKTKIEICSKSNVGVPVFVSATWALCDTLNAKKWFFVNYSEMAHGIYFNAGNKICAIKLLNVMWKSFFRIPSHSKVINKKSISPIQKFPHTSHRSSWWRRVEYENFIFLIFNHRYASSSWKWF